MAKVSSSFDLPEELKKRLAEVAKESGRKQALLARSALYHFVELNSEQREQIIREYLNAGLD